MDTATFFARVLPRGGIKVLAELVPFRDKETGETKHGWRYTTYQSFEAMAEAVAQFESQRRTVYHACNAFGDWYLDEAKQKKRLRTQKNVVACRSLYDDIDVGKEGCYPDTKSAMAAVRAFITATGLPAPMVVYSGSGIHLYWALTEDITPDEWNILAVMKRRITTNFGLLVDTACDLDSARVLRPVGSTNRKRATPVTVIAKNDPAPTDPTVLRQKMAQYIANNDVPQLVSKRTENSGTKNAFAAALETNFPPSFATRVAEYCNVVRWFRDTGAPDEPIWHKCIGVLKHCEDGEEKIHEWSANYAGYQAAETQAKIDAWEHGPSTCLAIRSVAGDRCDGCQRQVKSPIQLGHVEETKPPAIEAIEEVAPPQASAVPIVPVDANVSDLVKRIWPQGFSERQGRLYRSVINPADGSVDHVCFCDTLFYAIGLIRNEEGVYDVEVEYITPYGAKRHFTMATSDIASADKLASALAAHTIFVYGKNGRAMSTEYLRHQILGLSSHKREVATEEAYGWAPDGNSFVIGVNRVLPSGEQPVRLSEHVTKGRMAVDYGVSGTRQDWVRLVDKVYNRPGAEMYQFAFLVAAASPLISLVGIDGFHGVPVAYTGKGGRGKTTACELACSIWGKGEMFKQGSNKAGSTINGLIAKTAIFRHLPWVMDELTGQDTGEIAGMLYSLSNGTSKIRLGSSGDFTGRVLNWDLFTFVTGNMDITGLLGSLDNMMADAVQVRCFEIKVPEDFNERVFADVNFKQLVDIELRANYGVVGRELIRYYMNKRTKIIANVHALRQKYNPRTADESRERFYIDLICFAMVAGAIMRKLGLIGFDLDAILSWAMGNVKALRNTRADKNYTDEELIGQMLASMHDKTLVTKHILDTRRSGSREIPMTVPRVTPEARLATEDRRLFISVKAVVDWCRDQSISPSFMRDALFKHGYVVATMGGDASGVVRFRLGQGTNIALGLARCYELHYDKVYGTDADATAGNVIPIRAGGQVADSVARDVEEPGIADVTA